MKLKKISRGLYVSEKGSFYTRPTVAKTRQLRQLKARTIAAAKDEMASVTFRVKHPFDELAQAWLNAGCPDGNNRSRMDDYVERARVSLKNPILYFGSDDIHSLGPRKVGQYGEWRAKRVVKANCMGARVADLELAACASLFNWAKRTEITTNDPFAGRSRFQRAGEVKHSTERAPQSGDEVHRIGRLLLDNPRSRSSGFLWMFLCLTGCRCGELRKLRLDAKPNGISKPPGYYTPHEIVVARGKQEQAGSRNPHGVIPLSEPAQGLLRAWEAWHKEEALGSPYWFPGRNRQAPLNEGTLTRMLAKTCKRLGIEKISAHGARSFFTNVLRQTEPDDRVVAARLGHANPIMIQNIYGDRMTEKRPELTWLPSEGEPAWIFKSYSEGTTLPPLPSNRMPVEI